VIVLRVLTKEEIQAYAVKTQEIRGMFSLRRILCGANTNVLRCPLQSRPRRTP
jgi:hypothetical protein